MFSLEAMCVRPECVRRMRRSLRLSPLIPGWLFSIVAPLLPMSAGRFGLVTLLACIPPSALTVQIGAVLSRMQVRLRHTCARSGFGL